ncbi:MAG: glycosyl transferase [Eubacteriales bacterium]|nr:glycosyl transferase [Eubacteriales bacterium]
MKALILSCNTGQGHNTAGKAVLEALQLRGVPCEMKDALSFGGERTSVRVSGSYIRITQAVPSLFGRLYRAGALISSCRHKSPVYFANTLYADRLSRYITENGFDIILSPHLFPAEALTFLRRKRGLRVRSYGIATDYTCSPFWEETDVDRFFIPHEALRPEYESKGFAPQRLLATGIPVSRAFREKKSVAEARGELGLSCAGRVFLMMTGSMGFGDVPELTQALLARVAPDDRILILAGRNERLAARLRAKYGADERVRLVPFTRRVPLYMDACDVLLSKPGGLSSTEAAAKNVPLVHTAPIPGCETANAHLFAMRGLSIATRTPQESAEAAVYLAGDEGAKRRQLEAQRSFVNAAAADDIVNALLRG